MTTTSYRPPQPDATWTSAVVGVAAGPARRGVRRLALALLASARDQPRFYPEMLSLMAVAVLGVSSMAVALIPWRAIEYAPALVWALLLCAAGLLYGVVVLAWWVAASFVCIAADLGWIEEEAR